MRQTLLDLERLVKDVRTRLRDEHLGQPSVCITEGLGCCR